jgi:hypothetical protein
MRRITIPIVVLALALSAAACGGREEPRYDRITAAMPGGFELPVPVDAVPTFAVFPKEPLGDNDVRRVRRLDQVVAAARVKLTQVEIEGPNGKTPLQLGATSPLKFRPVAPDPTRDADFVWTSLIGGRAVVTYEAAADLGITGAAPLTIPSLGEVRVGAFAENGTPSNLADVLVSEHIVDRMPGEPIEVLVVGSVEGTDTESLGEELKQGLPEARLLPLVQVFGDDSITTDAAPQPLPRGESAAGLGGTMSFTILDDGWIQPDEAWVEANITQAEVPILGSVTCHRVMIPQLSAALAEIESEGLASLIRPEDYAGCYAPRFIDRNPDLPLSNHAFGLAVDLNSDTNQLGTAGDMDPRIVEIFEKWGFEWGGHWDRPDPMHFELARLFAPEG